MGHINLERTRGKSLTWAVKWNNLVGYFFCGAEGNEIHVFNLFAVVGNNAVSPTAAEIGV